MSGVDLDRLLSKTDPLQRLDSTLGIESVKAPSSQSSLSRGNMFAPRTSEPTRQELAENYLRTEDISLEHYLQLGGQTQARDEKEWSYELLARREQLAKVAWDDWEELTQLTSGDIPQLYSPESEATWWDATGKAVYRGGYNIVGSVSRRLNTLQSYITGEKSRAMSAFDLGRKTYFASRPEKSALQSEAWWENLTSGKKLANTVFSNAPYMLFTLGSTIATGGGAAGIAAAGSIAYLVEGQEAYDRAIEAGADTKTAEWSANIVGSINAVIELAQISEFLKLNKAGTRALAARSSKAAYKKFLSFKAGKTVGYTTRRHLASIARESVEEVLQGTVGDLAAKHLYNQESSWGDWLNSRLTEAISAAGATVLFGVPSFVAGSHGIKFTKQETSDIYKHIDADFVTKQITENYNISEKKAHKIALDGLVELENIRQVTSSELTREQELEVFNTDIMPGLLNEFQAREKIRESLDEAIEKIPEADRVEIENVQSKNLLSAHLNVSESAAAGLVENQRTRAQALLLRDALENEDVDEVTRLTGSLRAHLSNVIAEKDSLTGLLTNEETSQPINEDSLEYLIEESYITRKAMTNALPIAGTSVKLLDLPQTMTEGSLAEKETYQKAANSPVYESLANSIPQGFELLTNSLFQQNLFTRKTESDTLAEFGGFAMGAADDFLGIYHYSNTLGTEKDLVFLNAASVWLENKAEAKIIEDTLGLDEALAFYSGKLIDATLHEITHNEASHRKESDDFEGTLSQFDKATEAEQANAITLVLESLKGLSYDTINNFFQVTEAWASRRGTSREVIKRNAIKARETGQDVGLETGSTKTGLQAERVGESLGRATTEAISQRQRVEFGDTLKNPDNVDPASVSKGPPSDYNNTLGENARKREESGKKYRFGLMSHTIFDLVDNIGHIEQALGLPGLYELGVAAERGFMHSRAYQSATYERINKAAGQDARLLPLEQQLLIAQSLNNPENVFPDEMSPASIAVAKELRKIDNEPGGGKYKEKHNRLLHFAQTGNTMGLTGDRLTALKEYDSLKSLKGEELSNELQRLSKSPETDFLVVSNYSLRMSQRFISNIVGENMNIKAYMAPKGPGQKMLQSRVTKEGAPADDFVSEILHHYILQDRYYEMALPINELWKQASPHLQAGSMNTLKKALQRLVGVYDSPLSSTLLEVQKSMSNLFKVPASTGKLQLKQFVQRLFGRTNMPIQQALSLYSANKAAFEKKWGSDMAEYMEKRIIMERPLYKELYADFTATPWKDLTNAGKIIRTVGNNPAINYMNSLFADYMADAHIWLDGKNRYSTMDSWLTTATDVLKKKRLPWNQASKKLGFSKLMPWEQNYLEGLYSKGKIDDVILETARLQTEHNQYKYIKPLRDFFSNTTIGMPTMQYATWWRNYVKLWYTQLYNLKNGDSHMKVESVKSLANHLALSVVGGTVFSAIVGQLKGGRDLPERLLNTAAAQLDPFSYGGVGGVNTLFTPVTIIGKFAKGDMPSQIWAAARSFTKGAQHASVLIGRSIQYGFDRDEITLDKLKIEARDLANVGEEYLNYYYWGYRRATAILDSWGDKRRSKYLREAGRELFGIDYKPKVQERSALLRIQNALFVTNPPTSTGDIHGAIKNVALENTSDDYVNSYMKTLVKNGTTLRDALRVLDKWGREKVERKTTRGRQTIVKTKPRFERETLVRKKNILRRRWNNYNREH